MSAQIEKLIRKKIQFPTLPAIAVQILNVVKKDEAPLSELADLISSDPTLSAKMLKVANSGLYAGAGTIANINRAISVLGTNTIKSVALSFVIASDLGRGEYTGFSLDDFWRFSISSAVSAELITKLLGHENDDIFVIALLQNIGILAILLTQGEAYSEILLEEQESQCDLSELERVKFGFDHQQVGTALLKHWRLPAAICEPILYHHCPEAAPDAHRNVAEILRYAGRIAGICLGEDIAEKARCLQNEFVTKYSVSEEEALNLLDAAAEKSQEVISAFDLDPGSIQSYSRLLQQANAELGELNLSNAQIILEMQEAKSKAEKMSNKLHKANLLLKDLVSKDGLTGLYNHRHFQETLNQEVIRAGRYQSSLSLVMFDIDDFKVINDTHGHSVGDAVLKNIAKVVKEAVRTNDLVARYGGDEFAVILPQTNKEGAEAFCKHLRLRVEGGSLTESGQLVKVTVSVGAATFNPSNSALTKDQLINAADRGMYLSKRSGRNHITVLDPEE